MTKKVAVYKLRIKRKSNNRWPIKVYMWNSRKSQKRVYNQSNNMRDANQCGILRFAGKMQSFGVQLTFQVYYKVTWSQNP